MEEEVTHKQIYDRLVAVETKVNDIDENTKGLVKAFNALHGAFVVLETIGKLAKPLLWFMGVVSVAVVWWQQIWKK